MKGKIQVVQKNKEHTLLRVKTEDLPNLQMKKGYRETLLDYHLEHGFPELNYVYDDEKVEIWKNEKRRIVERDEKGRFKTLTPFVMKTYHPQIRSRKSIEGNVVLAYTSSNILMLDCDLKREDEVREFSEEYAKFQDLGSSLVMKTSDSIQTDLFGNVLGNYAIIFGKVLSWDEIRWHVKEAYRLGIVNRGFVIIRKFGSITIRVNAKNNKIPPPKIVSFFANGDKRGRIGIWGFLKHWAMCKKEGMDIEEVRRWKEEGERRRQKKRSLRGC